jgi:hypothetical protein
VRAHVLLWMLAYHVEHYMRARLAPMLYDQTDHKAAAALRASIVAKAERFEAARRKQTTGLTDDGLPVHSFQSLLADLATYARIQTTTALNENTSSRSTPGRLRSSSAPSSSSPLTRIVPSKATRARDKQQRAHCLIDSKEGSSV